MVHRCGPPGRRDSGPGLPTAPASHDTLRKNRAAFVSQGASFQSHHLPVAHSPHLFAVQVRISWNLWYSAELRSGEESRSESGSKKGK